MKVRITYHPSWDHNPDDLTGRIGEYNDGLFDGIFVGYCEYVEIVLCPQDLLVTGSAYTCEVYATALLYAMKESPEFLPEILDNQRIVTYGDCYCIETNWRGERYYQPEPSTIL